MQTIMKILRFSLLGLALGFLVVPMWWSNPVYADDRDSYVDDEQVLSMNGPVESAPSSSHAVGITQPHFYYGSLESELQFAWDWVALAAIIGIAVGILTIAAFTFAFIQWATARYMQNKWKFLTKYTDEQTRRYARALANFMMSEVRACDQYDRRVVVQDTKYNMLTIIHINYEVDVADDDSGEYWCWNVKDTSDVKFAKDLDDWVKDNYSS